MKYKLLKEEEEHFIVDDGDGKPYKVAKGRLAHKTVEKIRKHYAEGGEVKPEENPWFPDTGAADADRAAVLRAASAVLPVDNPGAGASTGPGMLADVPTSAPSTDGLENAPFGNTSPFSPQAAPSMPPVSGKPPTVPPEIQAGATQQQEGLQKEAAAQAAGLREQARIQAESAAKQGADRQALQTMFQTRQAKADELFNGIMSDKIDPKRIWNTPGTGTARQITSAVGILLGGIGSGLTGQPNAALQIVDKALDRDIEAQKFNIGKKVTGLTQYMSQTRDLEASSRLLKADYLDATAAQLASAAAKSGAPAVMAEAQKNIGIMRQQAVAARQEGTLREYQIGEAKIGLQQRQFEVSALQQLLKGVSGGGGFPRQILELPAFEKYRERAVDMPDGSVAFADDKTEADKARDSMTSVANLKAKLSRYSDLLKSGNPATLDRGSAQAQHADILAEMGHLHELNRLTDVDLGLFKNQVPDISDMIKPFAAQKIRALGDSIDDRVWAKNQAILHRPSRRGR